jgi:hypothetical protein
LLTYTGLYNMMVLVQAVFYFVNMELSKKAQHPFEEGVGASQAIP